ncbi:MAG: polysaccharide deacetylase family protein [Candidatus Electrothrix sp. GW3-4]|uniref:polysaccharide deacetylase family protein n=1 Tax=Candidatus Electrothrix sp. GW3-4 TaxID=3126740 RepID=UPI0030CD82BB
MVGHHFLFSQKIKRKKYIYQQQENPLLNEEQKKYAIAYFLDKMKTTPYENNKELLKTLSCACNVDIPSPEKQSGQLMTWEQLNEVTEHNIAIGSHTHTHRVLSTLNEREQFHELEKSKKILEQRLGDTIHSMSYPVGGYLHFSDQTKALAQQAGYKLCFSYETGFNRKRIDAYNVKRIGLSGVTSIMKGQLFMPSVFC